MSSATITQALWRQRYLAVLVATIFVLIGCTVTLVTPTAYTATATLYLDTARNSQNFDVALQSAQLLQHDFIVLATQQPVVSEACAASGVTCSAAELVNPDKVLKKRLTVNYLNGTSMLTVTAKASTATEAAAVTSGLLATRR